MQVPAEQAKRAATLAKCDLMTEMVGEFPELQGIMGRYYALHDGEAPEVAQAILEHYMPRFASDDTPATPLGQVVAIADKLDTLVGIFSIGQIPTGDKDPFALRRAALGVLRTMIENRLDLDLPALLEHAGKQLPSADKKTVAAVFDFMMERLKGYYLEAGYRPQVFDAVLATRPARPLDFHARLQAIAAFEKTDAAQSLAAANKRIANILRKSESDTGETIDPKLFETPQENALFEGLNNIENDLREAIAQHDYQRALTELSQLKEPVDEFFDNVMVNTEDKKIRANRLALLSRLYEQFLKVADISRLS